MSIVLDVMYMVDQVIMRYSICMARPIQEQGALEEKSTYTYNPFVQNLDLPSTVKLNHKRKCLFL
ncbi:hypothetical protein ACVWXS_004370 [Lysinibacillus sp. TE18511]